MFINFGLYFWNIDLIWLGVLLRWRRLTNYKIPRFGPEISIGSIPVFCSSSPVHVFSPVLVEDVWYQRLVPSQSPAKCGKRSWGFTAGICVSLFSFSSFWCDSASRDTSQRMHIWPVSKVESFKSLLGFHSVDAGFVALVLFDFLLSSWWYSLDLKLVLEEYQYFAPVLLSTWSLLVLVEDVCLTSTFQRLVPSQSPAKCGKRSWVFKTKHQAFCNSFGKVREDLWIYKGLIGPFCSRLFLGLGLGWSNLPLWFFVCQIFVTQDLQLYISVTLSIIVKEGIGLTSIWRRRENSAAGTTQNRKQWTC